jgi:hypothetical protein
MLNNKQRAHDIAVAMLSKTIEMRMNEKINQIGQGVVISEIPIDIYQEYLGLYESALIPLTRDFPDDV